MKDMTRRRFLQYAGDAWPWRLGAARRTGQTDCLSQDHPGKPGGDGTQGRKTDESVVRWI